MCKYYINDHNDARHFTMNQILFASLRLAQRFNDLSALIKFEMTIVV